MPHPARWLLLLGLSWTCAAASAGAGDVPPSPAQPQGYVISDRLIEVMMKRWTFDLADDLDLSEVEEAEVFETLRQRWVPFVKKNQEKLAPLIERYMHAMIDPEPPAPEEVKAWAQEALELQDQILEQVNLTEKDVSELMPPDKIGRLRGEFIQMRMGMGYMTNKFEQWKRGEFDAGMWDRQTERRAKRRDRRRERWQKEREAEFAQLVSMSEWDRYVEEFVSRFQLDPAQKTSASAVLTDVKQRARSYLDAHEGDINRAKLELANSGSTTTLFQPLEALFAELQTRLDKIPTEAQRARVRDESDGEQGPSGQS